eukprot:scaffold51376_cov62-Phaeocystis_antarctica.AAC.8
MGAQHIYAELICASSRRCSFLSAFSRTAPPSRPEEAPSAVPPLGEDFASLGLASRSRAPQRRRCSSAWPSCLAANRRSDQGSSWSEACSNTDCRTGEKVLLSGPEFAFGLQQPVQALDGAERLRMTIAEGFAHPLQRLAEQRLGGGEVALGMQQPAEVADGVERVRMPIAEGLSLPLHRLAAQRLSGGEVALGLQQHAEVVDVHERVRMPAAKGLAQPLQRLAAQRLSGGEVALVHQQPAKVADGAERVRMPIAEGLASPLQRLSAQRLSGGEVTLGV